MRFHSVTDIITNSSAVVFTIKTDMEPLEFERRIAQLYAAVSELPYPFEIINPVPEGYAFSAGYYWGFVGFPEHVDYEKEEELFTHLLNAYFGPENVFKEEVG